MTYKILGQVNPSAAVQTILYTNGVNTQTVCSTISVCNQGLSTTYSVIVHKSTTFVTAKDYIIHDAVLAANETKFITIGITLSDIDSITVVAGTGDVSFNMFGETLPNIPSTNTQIEETPWVRPSYWLDLPEILESESKFVGLYAVEKESNYVAFSCVGNYVVDWGDGSAAEHKLSGSTAQHQYTYDSISDSTLAPVTIVSGTNRIERLTHGFKDEESISLYNITGSTEINDITLYYVINSDTNSFQISTTIGGSPISLSNGTATLLNHKQVVITITPDTAASLTSLNLNVIPSVYSARCNVHWVDMHMSIPELTSLIINQTQNLYFYRLKSCKIGKNSVTDFSTMFLSCLALEYYELDTSLGTDFSYMFSGCISLKSVPLFDTSKGTDFSYMFYYCESIKSIPLFDTSKGTVFSYMFEYCYLLETIPLFDTSNGTVFSYMFAYCKSIKSIPLFDTSNGTVFSFMFAYCESIKSIPLFDTSLGTDFSYMFYYCESIKSIPLFDTSKGTTMTAMFAYCESIKSIPLLNTSNCTSFDSFLISCYNLEEVPLFDTSKGLSFYNMFNGCSNIKTIPLLNTSSGTNFSGMFQGCKKIKSIPTYVTTKGTNFTSMFANCWELTAVPSLNTSSGTNFGSMFSGCYKLAEIGQLNFTAATTLTTMFTGCCSLTDSNVINTKLSVSYISCSLSAAALNEIYTNLGTVTAKTITVLNNPGTASDTPSIATAKGWTVTG